MSVVSKESSVPLTVGDSLVPQDIRRPSPHSRNSSHASDGLLLMRPLEPVLQGGTLPNTGKKSIHSSPPASPTSPQQSYLPLRVTNVDETEIGSTHGDASNVGQSKRTRHESAQSPVLVHLDGGRLASGSGGRSDPEADAPDENPPAYSKTG